MSGYTGAEAAEQILRGAGISNIAISNGTNYWAIITIRSTPKRAMMYWQWPGSGPEPRCASKFNSAKPNDSRVSRPRGNHLSSGPHG